MPYRDHLEPLESRRLLSASLNAGQLVVTGTDQRDVIVFSLSPGDSSRLLVRMNGQAHAFDVAGITRGVVATGGNGYDSITVDERAGQILLSCTLSGGNGKDVLAGGSGKDLLYGGNGSDRLYGNAGADFLKGNDGKDDLKGADGDDAVEGSGDDDVVDGGAGDDVLLGGHGKDKVYGGDGSDDMDGGDDLDRIFGGRGTDRFANADRRSEVHDKGKSDDKSPMLSLDQVPTVVADAFAAAFSDATVLNIKKQVSGETTSYSFRFLHQGRGWKALFASDGTYTMDDEPGEQDEDHGEADDQHSEQDDEHGEADDQHDQADA